MSWKKCIVRPVLGQWIRPAANLPPPDSYGPDGGEAFRLVHKCFVTEGAQIGGSVLARFEVWTGDGDPPPPHTTQPFVGRVDAETTRDLWLSIFSDGSRS